METTKLNLRHFKGAQAYLIRWADYYDCNIKISSLMALERNLEVIMTSGGNVAYYYDPPEEMKGLLQGEGE